MFLNENNLISIIDNQVSIVNLINKKKLITKYGAKPIQMIKQHDCNTKSLLGVVLTLENNQGSVIWSDQLRVPDLNKAYVGYFYSPPKCKQILQIIPSIYDNEYFYMLIESGDVCEFKVDNLIPVQQKYIKVNQVEDFEKHCIT